MKKNILTKKKKKKKINVFYEFTSAIQYIAKNINEDFLSDYGNLPKDSNVEKMLKFNDKYNKLKC